MKVEVKFNAKGAKSRLMALGSRAQFKLDDQAAKDSNFYCPEDVGILQGSVLKSAQRAQGMLIWGEKYAAKQYYSAPNKSLDRNPNARMHWFEHAKAAKKSTWVKLAQDVFN
jgi:Minor capsid protein